MTYSQNGTTISTGWDFPAFNFGILSITLGIGEYNYGNRGYSSISINVNVGLTKGVPFTPSRTITVFDKNVNVPRDSSKFGASTLIGAGIGGGKVFSVNPETLESTPIGTQFSLMPSLSGLVTGSYTWTVLTSDPSIENARALDRDSVWGYSGAKISFTPPASRDPVSGLPLLGFDLDGSPVYATQSYSGGRNANLASWGLDAPSERITMSMRPGVSPTVSGTMADARALDRASVAGYSGRYSGLGGLASPSEEGPGPGLGGYGGGNRDGTGYRGGGANADRRSRGRRRSLSPRRSVKPQRIVMDDGSVRAVTGKRIVWSEQNAHLYGGRAKQAGWTDGSVALAEAVTQIGRQTC